MSKATGKRYSDEEIKSLLKRAKRHGYSLAAGSQLEQMTIGELEAGLAILDKVTNA